MSDFSMPQMSPMNWLILFLIFNFSFSIVISKIQYV